MMIADPNKSFTRDDLAIYYVDHNEEDAILRPIEIKENLEYSFWPSGLFEDNFNIISEIDQLSL
jgi:predicted ATPase